MPDALGSSVSFTLTVPTGAAAIVADEIASSNAEVIALLDAWEADWGGTVPDGKTSTNMRVIGIDYDVDASLDLTGYDFSAASGRRRVYIRQEGSFTTSGSGNSTALSATYSVTEDIDLSGSKGIYLYLMFFDGTSSGSNGGSRSKFVVDGTEDCGVSRCYLKGSFGDWTTMPGSPSGQNYAFYTAPGSTLTRFEFSDNLLHGWGNGSYLRAEMDECVIARNVVYIVAHDDWKIYGTSQSVRADHTDCVFTGNWGSRIRAAREEDIAGGAPFGGYHEDLIQFENCNTIRWEFSKNTQWIGPWYGSASGVHQGFFCDGGNGSGMGATDCVFTQNLHGINTGAVKLDDATVSGNSVTYCCGFQTRPRSTDMYTAFMYGAGGTEDYNLIASDDIVTDFGEGANGELIDLEDSASPVLDSQQDFLTGTPNDDAYFEVMLPKTGTRLHWDYAGGDGKVGCWEHLQDVFDLGLHPENVGWPVAPAWRHMYNLNGHASVPSDYSGTFDANGDNA